MSVKQAPRLARSLLLAAALAVTAAAFSPAAGAKVQTFKPVARKGSTIKFRVYGVQAASVRSGRIKLGRMSRRIRREKVRRGVRRRVVRVSVPRRWVRRQRAKVYRARARARSARGSKRARLMHTYRRAKKWPSRTRLKISTRTATIAGGDRPASLEPVPASARYVAPYGSDSSPGTSQRPWRTLAEAVASARPGDTVVLRPGTYGAPASVNRMNRGGTASAPVTFRGEPGKARPRILGFFKITSSYQRFSYLLFDGPTGRVKTPNSHNRKGEEVQVSVIGDAVNGIEISSSEIRDSAWHAGIYLSNANDARILSNHIHDNGDRSDPGQANQSHGIYWDSGSGRIVNNVIRGNVARGIQLYQRPAGVTIKHNTVVGNGKAGIQFAEATRDSVAVNNVVTGNEYGIRSSELSGRGNVVRNNLLSGNRRGDLALTAGLTLIDNTLADPRFASASNLKVRTSSAAIDEALPEYTPSVDIDGTARPRHGAPDLGAYEAG